MALRTARQWGEPASSVLDDLVQETYLKLCAEDCRLLKNFRARHAHAIFGFLKVVTANVVHDHYKASRAVKRGAAECFENLDNRALGEQWATNRPNKPTSSTVEQAILFEEIDRCLIEGVAAAEVPRSRRIFWLYYRCGLSARAIAALPNIDLTTKGVESTILRLSRLVRTTFARSPRLKNCSDNAYDLRDKGVHRPGSL